VEEVYFYSFYLDRGKEGDRGDIPSPILGEGEEIIEERKEEERRGGRCPFFCD